jgi:hypothetical protein
MADKVEIEQVLSNWIAQATKPPGRLVDGVEPARWIAQQFLKWWQSQVRDELSDADRAMSAVRQELQRLGGSSNQELGEALQELTHATDALAGLRDILGFDSNSSSG